MKMSVIISSLLVASTVFAADFAGKSNSQIISSINSSDTKSLADAAFELRKRASFAEKEIKDSCFAFHNIMQNEMKGKNAQDKIAFRDEFHKELSNNMKNLSSDEKIVFDFNVCRKYIQPVNFNKNKKSNKPQRGARNNGGYMMNATGPGMQNGNCAGMGPCNQNMF